MDFYNFLFLDGDFFFVGISWLIAFKTWEIVVTNKRFVFKTGWISRRTEEINMDRIEEVNVNQGIIGRMLGYGNVKVTGTGGSEIQVPIIDNPLALRKALVEARDGGLQKK